MGEARRPPVWLPRLAALLALVNLLAALAGGLQRLGSLPPALQGVAHQALLQHGALMMAGFFATLIALERAVALRRGLYVPLLAGLGGAAHLHGLAPLGHALWLASALGLLALYAWAARHRGAALPLRVEASGAAMLLLGHAAHALGQPALARWGWSLFLVLTIAGERRELTRLLPLSALARRGFIALWLALLALPLLWLWRPAVGDAAGWALLGLLALWLLAYDLARRQWRLRSWAGHTALCLLVGYGWLALAALAGLSGQAVAWHLLWLGFVFAMVFGHAPIMLPALAGLRPRHSRWALAPLALMAASLLLRAALPRWPAAAPWAGAGHVLALLGFAALMAWCCRPLPRRGAGPRP